MALFYFIKLFELLASMYPIEVCSVVFMEFVLIVS